MSSAGGGITLDTSIEPWIGVFPGLGSVRVFADGTYDVAPVQIDVADPGAESEANQPGEDLLEERRRALTHGWAEPLSWARQGYVVAAGTTLVEPESGRAVLLVGRAKPQLVIVRSLIGAGWSVAADGLTPIDDSSGLPLAVPTSAPLLLPVGETRDSPQPLERARTDTDAVMVPVARVTAPVPLAAVLVCMDFNIGDKPEITPVTGVAKVSRILGALVGGALGAQDGPGPDLARITAWATIAVGIICEGQPDLDPPQAVRDWMKGLAHG